MNLTDQTKLTKGSKPNSNLYISITATILLLIGISYLMLQPKGMHRLANENYEVPFPQIQRAKVPAEDSLFYAAMAAFGRTNWKNAISLFNQIEVSHPMHQRILYYMAHAFVGLGEYEKALALFNNPVLKDGQYVQQTEWNKVLMRMFLKHPKEEIIIDLAAIANNNEQFYHDQAKQVLKQLGVKDFQK